jgi:hypothetical protein
MSDTFHVLAASGIRVRLDLRVGHIRDLTIERGRRSVSPLHTAPWVDEPTIANDVNLPGNLRFLSGDFFCAPFAAGDLENSPPHGWPANSAWRLQEINGADFGTVGRYELARPVMGAKVFKELTLRHDHPFVYERHVFVGGQGAVSVANHAMIRFEGNGRLAFSKKAYGRTPAQALETDPTRGRAKLAYPSKFDNLRSVATAEGTTVDLTYYPIGERHEDFVMLVEDFGNKIGWTSAWRPDRADVFLSLKTAAVLPVTFLWYSNGGRDYHPWNGRHVGVLGVEEGCSYFGAGHKASIEPNDLSSSGVATAIKLVRDGEVEVRNVIGCMPVRDSFPGVADIQSSEGLLTVIDVNGDREACAFDDRFLASD